VLESGRLCFVTSHRKSGPEIEFYQDRIPIGGGGQYHAGILFDGEAIGWNYTFVPVPQYRLHKILWLLGIAVATPVKFRGQIALIFHAFANITNIYIIFNIKLNSNF